MGLLFIKTSPVKHCSHENDFSGVFDALHQNFLILIVIVRPLLASLFDYLVNLFRTAWWTTAGKELTSWLSACTVLLYAILIVCVPFPYGIWGRMWNSNVSVPDHCLFIYPGKRGMNFSSFNWGRGCISSGQLWGKLKAVYSVSCEKMHYV